MDRRLRVRIALLTVCAIGALGAAGIVPARAATSPSSGDVYAGTPGPATFSWTGGPLLGNPDPVGPPAPACTPGACEREPVTVHAPAAFTATNTLTLSATVQTASGSAPGSSTWDIAIIDSSGNTVASSGAGTNPDKATATNVAAGTYTVEVDGDIAAGDTYAATAALSAAPKSAAGGGPSYSANGIAFSTPTIVDPIRMGGEPDIAINPANGKVFSSAPTGTGTQRSIWFGSNDKGHTFYPINAGPAPSALQSQNQPPGGGDTDIAFAGDGSKQYFADLYDLACFRVATTTDNGGTVSSNAVPGGCGGSAPSDRQWYAVYDPPAGVTSTSAYKAAGGTTPLVYLEYNNVASATPGNSGLGHWNKSADGLTFSNADTRDEFGADGYPSIDQVTGDVFQAEYSGGDVLLNIGTPDATGNLTFLDQQTPPQSFIPVAHNVPNDSGEAANFVVSSMDSGRNLWVAWVGRSKTPSLRQTWISVASAASGWKTWSTPVQVSAAPSEVSVFPWIKGGGPGQADVVWYGSSGGDTAQGAPDPSVDAGQKWDVFMSQVTYATDAHGGVKTSTSPAVSMAKATPHPMHYNSICLNGTACIASQGNRNLADFFNIAIDSDGSAYIVYNDTSNGLLQAGFPTSNQALDHAGGALISVLHQSAGPGVRGAAVSGTPNTPVTHLDDPPGDALYPVVGGTNQAALDLLGSSVTPTADGSGITVTMKVADLGTPAITSAIQATSGPFLQYVTRWQMGNTLYDAIAETTASGTFTYSAGPTDSVDLCSVSACDPHVLVYPDSAPDGHTETGTQTCPPTPSAANPCVITITVSPGDVGAGNGSHLFEEVGAYALTSSHPQTGTTNAQAQADNVPLSIDGVCCYNDTVALTAVSASTPTPSPTAGASPTASPTPSGGGGPVGPTPAPPGTGAAIGAIGFLLLLGGGFLVWRSRRGGHSGPVP